MKTQLAATLILAVLCSCSRSLFFSGPDEPASFTPTETAYINSAPATEPMRVFTTPRTSDSLLLRRNSEAVVFGNDDTTLRTLVQRMYATVTEEASMGPGLAAPQVGILKRIIWVKRLDREGMPYEVYLNPRIVQKSTLTQDGREGCLSVPNQRDTVTRPYAIVVEYNKMDRSHHLEIVEDSTAVIFQHQIDHLNGLFFTDHVPDPTNHARPVSERQD